MKLVRTTFVFCAFALGLAGCAGPAPTGAAIESAARDNIVISDVSVDVSKMGGKTQGRAVPASNVKALVQKEADYQLKGHGNGSRKTRAILTVDNVNVITAGQSILIGGESTMTGTISLVDARTNAVILAPTKVSAGGGGWVAGGIIAAATRDDAATELRQMSNEFTARARILVLGKPQDQLAASAKSSSTQENTSKPSQASGDSTAVRNAELAARKNYHPACSSLACERASARAKKEAALNSN